MKTLFTAKAISQGGRNGHSKTTDGKLAFELGTPGAATTKTGVVTNPEELFACGYAACFGSALEHVAGHKKVSVTGSTIGAEVSLNSDETGFFLSITLTATIPGMDAVTAKELVEAAHQVCPYSKATRNNVQVTLKVAEEPLAKAS